MKATIEGHDVQVASELGMFQIDHIKWERTNDYVECVEATDIYFQDEALGEWVKIPSFLIKSKCWNGETWETTIQNLFLEEVLKDKDWEGAYEAKYTLPTQEDARRYMEAPK
jgi:hypothetical protein